jgi:ElaB/YqjD/DUF883 family membrane-anchored ribosome-binding protein
MMRSEPHSEVGARHDTVCGRACARSAEAKKERTKIMSSTDVVRERLHSDIALLTADLEELLKATGDNAGNGLQALRHSIVGKLESGKNTLAQKERMLKETSKQGAKAAVDFARDNPWSAAGIALGSLTVLGVLLWNELAR